MESGALLLNTRFPSFLIFSSYISLMESIHMISSLLLLHEARCLWASTRTELRSNYLRFQNKNPIACLKMLPATGPWKFADGENFSANRKYIVFQQISKAYKIEFESAFSFSFEQTS